MKIALSNLKRILDICTKKEIDLIIYIGQFQDKSGVVKGIDYKDVMKNIDICKSTFYKLLYSLEVKNIIEINYINEYGYWEVKFVDNEFKNQEDYKKGYLKLNFTILHSDAFRAMTKSEKIVIIQLLRINDFKKHYIKITVGRIMDWTGKSLRSALKFIETISKVLKVIKEGNLCQVDCLIGFSERTTSEVDTKNQHLINYRLKKAKSQSTEKDIQDVCTVLKQYKKADDTHTIFTVVDDVIKKFGTLIPAYINKLLNVAM